MGLNIIKGLKRYYAHFRLKSELQSLGLDFHLMKFMSFGHQSFVWSHSCEGYLLRPNITNSFLFHFISCKHDCAVLKIFIRKIQIICVEKNIITKQLKNGASKIGLLAEKRQREKLKYRGFKIAPKLYQVDLQLGFLKEEYIQGKTLYEYIDRIEDLPDTGFEIFDQLFKVGHIKNQSLNKQYSLYEKKLRSMSKRINNDKLKKFLDNILRQIRNALHSRPQGSSVMFTDLVHADFNPRNNLIVNSLGDTKIIDWEHSSSGPVLFDYFYFLTQLNMASARWTEILHQKSKLILEADQYLGDQVRICFLHLIVIKLNLWEHKENLHRRSLSRRIGMLCDINETIEEYF